MECYCQLQISPKDYSHDPLLRPSFSEKIKLIIEVYHLDQLISTIYINPMSDSVANIPAEYLQYDVEKMISVADERNPTITIVIRKSVPDKTIGQMIQTAFDHITSYGYTEQLQAIQDNPDLSAYHHIYISVTSFYSMKYIDSLSFYGISGPSWMYYYPKEYNHVKGGFVWYKYRQNGMIYECAVHVADECNQYLSDDDVKYMKRKYLFNTRIKPEREYIFKYRFRKKDQKHE